ncbi:nuclear transport factor 2 family protein [Enterovibrio baiacu]|uniref:nuclear transport factor 2 family protein n=1 Tax=Enterovibrio baiacu TaxID=2491023 RepID=UPI001011647C|nr:nuclear transport factor 2 family protein [Enterovibrio baiacu]MBE1274342.1 nuclear transport factor 2 family protein [Enterovibrio baiacu]
MPQELQDAKQRVLAFYRALDRAATLDVPKVLETHCSADYQWRGCHPFNELEGQNAVSEQFWQPLKTSLKKLQRRQDIFMAGENSLASDGSVWVVSMGHLMGLFDCDWLGITKTGRMGFLRYCEFTQVVEGKIAQSAMFMDIPGLMVQAGVNPFMPQTGAQLIQPGPMNHYGLMFDEQRAEESAKTLSVINQMITDLGNWDHDLSLEEELALSWHDDMIWWGPTGIGASYSIERYAKQHSGVFRSSFSERVFNGHVCKFAEGEFGGFFGWPNLSLKPAGGFMGLPASDTFFDMRVIDIYRRDGNKLAENWVFIDLLHFFHQQGVDLLARNQYLNAETQCDVTTRL